MLSILIPTYNYNAYPLASQLAKQSINANILFETICIDDGSLSKINIENEKINTLTTFKSSRNLPYIHLNFLVGSTESG
jgi:hypothetical protein